jgi:hypothetical protein
MRGEQVRAKLSPAEAGGRVVPRAYLTGPGEGRTSPLGEAL